MAPQVCCSEVAAAGYIRVSSQMSTILCPGTGMPGHNNRALSVLTAAGGILPPPHHFHSFLWHLDRVWKDLSVAQGVWN